jgi:hypothetical protein
MENNKNPITSSHFYKTILKLIVCYELLREECPSGKFMRTIIRISYASWGILFNMLFQNIYPDMLIVLGKMSFLE